MKWYFTKIGWQSFFVMFKETYRSRKEGYSLEESLDRGKLAVYQWAKWEGHFDSDFNEFCRYYNEFELGKDEEKDGGEREAGASSN